VLSAPPECDGRPRGEYQADRYENPSQHHGKEVLTRLDVGSGHDVQHDSGAKGQAEYEARRRHEAGPKRVVATGLIHFFSLICVAVVRLNRIMHPRQYVIEGVTDC
tara:strand:- start:590 stop:907 length:318 start_codon:yes stop_codon:yes gene_type:complete